MSTAPRRLGKYELLQSLGQGNIGEVWKASDLSNHSDVAIKILHSDFQSDPHFMTRFTNEGRIITQLQHSNIVHVQEFAIAHPPQSNATAAYIVMDYIVGQTFTQYVQSTSHRGSIPSIADIVYLFTSLGSALDYMHANSIIHGNLKPQNILLNAQQKSHFPAGEPMLTDVGMLQVLGRAGAIGTPLYTSPEQARGQVATTRSDIYALGAILYEICTGVVPFRGDSSVTIMLQHINTLPTPPILINPNIPPALSEVILRAMAKNPVTRFPDASSLAAAVAEACSVQPSLRINRQPAVEEDTSQDAGMPILGVSRPLPSVSPSISQPLYDSSQFTPLPFSPSSLSSNPGQPALSNPNSLSGLQAFPQAESDTFTAMRSMQTQPRIQSTPPPPPANPEFTPPRPPAPGIQPAPVTAIFEPQQYKLPASLPAPAPLPVASPPAPNRPNRSGLRITDTPIYIVITVLALALLLLGSVVAANALFNKTQNTTTGIPDSNRVFFQDDALGRSDQLRIELQHVAKPNDGQTYFAWLQTSNNQVQPLGALPINNGTISFLYPGDAKHTNLVSITQGIFITQETTDTTPLIPGNNKAYQATFDTAPLQYIRNVLYITPNLPDKQGVAAALFDAVKSMNDKAVSVVDSTQSGHDYGLAWRQATRIIEIIDGTQYAASSGDRPANRSSQLNIPVGLLSSPSQSGYIDILDQQLDQIKQNVGNNTLLLQHIQNVKNAITDLRDWIQKIRTNDIQILKAADLNNATINSTALQIKQMTADAYTGRTIPPNTAPQPIPGSAGAFQAYTEAQYMAALTLQKV